MSSAPPVESPLPPELQTRPRSAANHLFGGVKYVYRTIAGLPWIFWCMFAIAGILVIPLATSIRKAREDARVCSSLSNMKHITIAHQNYLDTHYKRLVNAGDKSKSQLSWRVRVLPYMGEVELYDQFHLNESWDSEHNKRLIARMPERYVCPQVELPPGMTCYLSVTGTGTAFDDGKKRLGFRDITDGTSKTVLVVEADPDQAVIWTKPDDWEFDPNDPVRGLGHLYARGFTVGFADSHTEIIPNGTPPAIIKAMMTRNGGERGPLP